MAFVVCGLNHKTAPIQLREKIALSSATQDLLLHSLCESSQVQEAFILSTCNRTEIYCQTSDFQYVLKWWAQIHQIPLESLHSKVYIYKEWEAVKHALGVAIGLDSMMIGEPQILGQMKQAYQQANQAGTINTQLRPLFEYIFSAAKRIRNQSGIGINPVSIAYAGVQLISQFFQDLKPLKALLIGSGETANLVAKYLHQQGVTQFIVANRTLEKAEQIVKTFGGQAIAISNLAQYLPEADVIVSATTCPIPFINQSLIQHVLPQRQHAPMFFLDLAVPRDIEADVADLEHVKLYNIDDLQLMIDKGMEERKLAAMEAQKLIELEINNYIRHQRSLKANQVICDYRSQMQDLAKQELQRALNKLSAGQCQQSVLNEFSERLVNKLTHNPTHGLRQIASDGREDLFTLAQYLFNSKTSQTYEEIT